MSSQALRGLQKQINELKARVELLEGADNAKHRHSGGTLSLRKPPANGAKKSQTANDNA